MDQIRNRKQNAKTRYLFLIMNCIVCLESFIRKKNFDTCFCNTAIPFSDQHIHLVYIAQYQELKRIERKFLNIIFLNIRISTFKSFGKTCSFGRHTSPREDTTSKAVYYQFFFRNPKTHQNRSLRLEKQTKKIDNIFLRKSPFSLGSKMAAKNVS